MGEPRDFDRALAHYGVKGMKWGVRKSRKSSGPVSEDARVARKAQAKLKKTGVKSLSNKELQSVINRMNLERQYSTLNPSAVKKGNKAVKGILGVAGTVSSIVALANSPAGKAVKTALKNKAAGN